MSDELSPEQEAIVQAAVDRLNVGQAAQALHPPHVHALLGRCPWWRCGYVMTGQATDEQLGPVQHLMARALNRHIASHLN